MSDINEMVKAVMKEAAVVPENSWDEVLLHRICVAAIRVARKPAEKVVRDCVVMLEHWSAKTAPNFITGLHPAIDAAKAWLRETEQRCRDCGGLLPSVFNYCPQGDAGSECRP